MTFTRRDAVATILTGLAALILIGAHEAWNMPLIGDNHRGAAAAIMIVGIGACTAGAKRVGSVLFGVLGGAAFVFGVLALITGSLTVLSFLVADMVVMWALATGRHVRARPGRPVAG